MRIPPSKNQSKRYRSEGQAWTPWPCLASRTLPLGRARDAPVTHAEHEHSATYLTGHRLGAAALPVVKGYSAEG